MCVCVCGGGGGGGEGKSVYKDAYLLLCHVCFIRVIRHGHNSIIKYYLCKVHQINTTVLCPRS